MYIRLIIVTHIIFSFYCLPRSQRDTLHELEATLSANGDDYVA